MSRGFALCLIIQLIFKRAFSQLYFYGARSFNAYHPSPPLHHPSFPIPSPSLSLLSLSPLPFPHRPSLTTLRNKKQEKTRMWAWNAFKGPFGVPRAHKKPYGTSFIHSFIRSSSDEFANVFPIFSFLHTPGQLRRALHPSILR